MKSLTRILVLTLVVYGCMAQNASDKTEATKTTTTPKATTTTPKATTTTAKVTTTTAKVTTTPTPTTTPKATTTTAKVTTTTAKVTTTTAKVTTTTAKATTTTAKATTTSAAPLPDNRYLLKNAAGDVCAILDMNLAFVVPFTDTIEAPQKASFSLPKSSEVKVAGDCATTGNPTVNVTLTFFTENYNLTLQFRQNQGNAELSQGMLDFVYDAQRFPKSKALGNGNINNTAIGLTLSPVSGYYICKSSQEIDMSLKSTLTTTNLQIQVFGVKNANFTGSATTCPADLPKTSTAAPTTPAPTMPAEPVTHKYNFKDKDTGVVCVILQGGVRFSIDYDSTDNKTLTAKFDLPAAENSTITGTCGNTSQSLTVTWNTWSFMMGFKKDGANFDLDAINFKYVVDAKQFPGAKTMGAQSAGQSGLGKFSTSTSSYYKCSSENIRLNSTNFELNDFQYQAFRSANTTSVSGNAKECPLDQKLNNIVPIAVGAALAGLVVIVLIAYFIGRKKNRQGYESV